MQQLLGIGIYSLKGTNKKLTHNVKMLQYCLYRECELKQDLYANHARCMTKTLVVAGVDKLLSILNNQL